MELILMVEYCICGHRKENHEGKYNGFCWYLHPEELHPCKKFKLDNLRYIEDLAKERKLV